MENNNTISSTFSAEPFTDVSIEETTVIGSLMVDPNMQPPTEEMLPPKISSLMTNTINLSDNILSKLININDSQIYHEPTCHICSSPHRKDLETKYEMESKDYKALIEFAKNKGLITTIPALANHMEHHSQAGIRELQKVEYINRLNRLTTTHTSMLKTIEDTMAALEERQLAMNSIVPNKDVSVSEVEKLKTEGTTKIVAQKIALMKIYNEMVGKMKASSDNVISIPTDPFITLFNEALAKAKNQDQRDVINNILQKLTTIKI